MGDLVTERAPTAAADLATFDRHWWTYTYRVVGPDEVEVIVVATRDHLGSGRRHLVRCTALERRGNDELTGAILFEPVGCDDPVVLDR